MNASGSVTVTFTWNNGGDPNDKPPSAVVVKETATAKWEGSSGSADNGLGSPAVPYPDNSGAVSSGERYVVKEEPGVSFTLTWSPSASCQIAASGFPETMTAGLANVSYTPTVYLIRLNLVGTTKIADKDALLVGQALKPTVDLGGLSPAAATYAWTMAKKPIPFKSYTASNESATLVPWTDPTTTENSVVVYFRVAADDDVLSRITTQSPDLTINVKAPVSVRAPALNLPSVRQKCGKFNLLPSTGSPSNFRLSFAFPEQADPGISMKFWVETPIAFGQPGLFGVVQLVSDQSKWKVAGGSFEFVQSYRDIALDTSFPYRVWVAATPQDNQWFNFVDSPGFSEVALTTHVGLLYDCKFYLYIFYLPPDSTAGPSNYVSLHLIRWDAKGSADYLTDHWLGRDEGSGIKVRSPNPTQPVWSHRIGN